MSGARAHPSVLLGAAAALGVGFWIGRGFAPALLTHSPLLLIALAPIPSHVVLVAPLTSVIPLVLIGAARRLLASVLAFYIARAYGGAGIPWVKARYPKHASKLDLLERVFRRAGPLVVFVMPGPLVAALAGATSMRLPVFLPIAAAGHACWVYVNYKVGEALSAWLKPALAFIDQHALTLTALSIALVFAYSLRRRRKQAQMLRELATVAPGTPSADPNEELHRGEH